MVYCVGSTEYDEEDSDWACNEDFAPSNKYFTPDKALGKLDWMEFNSIMNTNIKEVINANLSYVPESIKYVCGGFDDGDLTLLWSK